jgi:23S rRNA pseudouridine2605 synthase
MLGDLPQGAIAEVKTRTLREQLGERIAAAAGADFAAPMVEREPPPTPAARSDPAPRGRNGPRSPGVANMRSGSKRKRRADADWIGEPERARREQRRRRPARGKRR